MAIRPTFVDQVLSQLPNETGQLTSRPQWEFTADGFILLLNERLQEGTAMVAGQMNNLLYPQNLISWGNCDIVVEEATRWRATITVLAQAPVDENDIPIPLTPTPPPFNSNLDLQGRVVLYEYLAHMPTRTTGIEQDRMFGVVLQRDLVTGDFTGKHYAMIQERRGEGQRVSLRNWRRTTL
jgi:hypothetical protein